ncbi:SHC-transforming protein 3-like [Notolabrus celidotus]|uniref:SHC-transforming protein 3-like n=1 Tax=Notolabrus celidotus TaxID=1203425 RepID=UPI00148FFD2B|nr:SHC-transforming protein 3-like [Notolabrus celidotus]
MREQTLPRLKSQTGLLPGMLKRTKYSRLRNDSLTSLEDPPKRLLPLKGDLCLDSDFAQLDPGTPTHHEPSTLRDFIPRVASIRLHSPISLRGPRGQTNIDGHTDRPLSSTEFCSGPDQRFRSQPSLMCPQAQSALCCTKRPVTLHRMASLPWTPGCPHRDGLCCLKTLSAADDCTVVRAANRAIHHHIKYMGSVEVTQSMRTLDFDTRMQVTREAISRLCERTSAKTALKAKKPICKALSAVLGQINLQFSGSRIILAVSTDSVTLISTSSLQKIAHHPMQAISFASGGDPDMADYIAYVAKDLCNQRACHILECPRGRATEVIDSIGQAFETRFRQLLSQPQQLLSNNLRSSVRLSHIWSPEDTLTEQKAKQQDGEVFQHRDYYNMIPGKTPAPVGVNNPRITGEEKHKDADLHGVCLSRPVSLYENCSVTEDTPAPSADSDEPGTGADPSSSLPETPISDLIRGEGWFHGRLGREEAESLLTCSGDFLVRESSSASGQYVLSGMEGVTVRHLLLVDPHGQVRTRDQVFLSVGHLVRFHMENQTPIISGSSELCLRQPVLQRH